MQMEFELEAQMLKKISFKVAHYLYQDHPTPPLFKDTSDLH